MLRQASDANKVKLIVNPDVFTLGIGKKKQRIYEKYAGILKEIVELIKVSEIKLSHRYSALAKTINYEMKAVGDLAREIHEEEDLLKLGFYEGHTRTIVPEKYKEDLSFFFKEELYIKKFLKFWQYVCVFKAEVQEIGSLTLF